MVTIPLLEIAGLIYGFHTGCNGKPLENLVIPPAGSLVANPLMNKFIILYQKRVIKKIGKIKDSLKKGDLIIRTPVYPKYFEEKKIKDLEPEKRANLETDIKDHLENLEFQIKHYQKNPQYIKRMISSGITVSATTFVGYVGGILWREFFS